MRWATKEMGSRTRPAGAPDAPSRLPEWESSSGQQQRSQQLAAESAGEPSGLQDVGDGLYLDIFLVGPPAAEEHNRPCHMRGIRGERPQASTVPRRMGEPALAAQLTRGRPPWMRRWMPPAGPPACPGGRATASGCQWRTSTTSQGRAARTNTGLPHHNWNHCRPLLATSIHPNDPSSPAEPCGGEGFH